MRNKEEMNRSTSESIKNIRYVFFLNLFFTLIEIIGGIATNSLAIVSDAIHDLGDSFSLGLAWYFEKISLKPSTARYTYGYKRYSLLAALINSLVLLAGSSYIIIIAVPRLIRPESVHSKGMFFLAVLGILVNGAAVIKLRKGKKISEKVLMLHLLEDVLGWLSVLIISVIINYKQLYILDPLLSIFISLFIIFQVIRKLKSVFSIFLQSIPPNMELDKIKDAVISIKNICDVHDVHIWTMDGNYHVSTIHISVDNRVANDEIDILKQKVRDIFKKYDIEHLTIEVCRDGDTCEFKKVP